MSTARLFKKYLPATYGQFMASILKILFKKIPESGIEALKANRKISDQNRIHDPIPNMK